MRRLMPLLDGMEHYAKVMDILCNGTPFLSWVWAPITLILRVASEYIEAFEKIMEGYSRIAASLTRFDVLSRAFANDHNLQQSLAAFYDDILQFHQHAYKFVRRNEWKLLFLTSWGRFQRRFDNVLDDLDRHGDLIDKQANALNIFEAQKIHREIRDWKEKSIESLSIQEKEQSGKQYQAIVAWLKYDDSDQLAIFDSISTEVNNFPGTCSWFIQHPKVQSWLQRRADAPLLWLQGIPGSGKSSICAQVVNFMMAGKMPVIHYFCSYSYASSIMYEQILKSLLLQLACRSSDVIAHIYSEYVLGKNSPKIPVLEQLLRKLLQVISHEPGRTEYMWIVLDGLSECQPGKQTRIASLVRHITSRLSSSGSTVCKALISCQGSTSLSNYLKKEHTIFLADEKIRLENAIWQYASHRLVSLTHRFAQLGLSRKEIEDIELGVAQKSDGMFLYARLVLDYLAANIFFSAEEMTTSLSQLPEKLTDFYQTILAQILAPLNPQSKDRVKCLFGWVAFQKRPLKRLELFSAVIFSPGNQGANNIAPDHILEVCGPLLDVKQDTTVTFIHSSVKLFLESSSMSMVINEDTTLTEQSSATLACLLSGCDVFGSTYNEHERQERVLKGMHGFHVYATEYWTDYLLSRVATADDSDEKSHLINLACNLAEKLDGIGEYPQSAECERQPEELDKRLGCLANYPVLFKHVSSFLRARSLRTLESLIFTSKDDGNSCTTPNASGADAVSSILAAYQQTLRHLLAQHDFPGISAESLKLFKAQLGHTAFTCRLKTCPGATNGFASEKQLTEHESSHLRQFPCTFTKCQYPPFVSDKALRIHVKTHRNAIPPRQRVHKSKVEISDKQSMSSTMPEFYPVFHTLIASSSSVGQRIFKPPSPSASMGYTEQNQTIEPQKMSPHTTRHRVLATGMDSSFDLPPSLGFFQNMDNTVAGMTSEGVNDDGLGLLEYMAMDPEGIFGQSPYFPKLGGEKSAHR
ncbi:hypothetical protein LX32DRAFT_394337 [Colletotrichum zoysiae]|uniref:NACHT domain-containing protein n=1 Tax=Colletotrichum zoysiae TaxID=1216348 RepID=A0AAD9HIB6_9PEZI|nr:hypothetical protein LX32DRAFT_394337 [Colletotrichum zoysiae]